MRCAALMLVLVAPLACAPPPEPAPSDYEGLVQFLFEHFDDEDVSSLQDGVETLSSLIREQSLREQAELGLYVDPPPAESIDALDDVDRNTSNLVGATLVTNSPHSPETLAATITWEGFGAVIADSYDVYERTFDTPSACFADKSCTQLTATSYAESRWAGLVEMKTRYRIAFRWISTTIGDVWLHRFWLVEPAGDPDGVTMRSNYYVAAALPESQGTARVHSSWFDIDFGALGLSEAFAFDTLLNNMKADAQRVDTWITDNPR